MTRLEEIEARLKYVTEGRWIPENGDGYSALTIWSGCAPSGARPNIGNLIATVVGDSAEAEANHSLIANAPADIRHLVDRVKRLEAAARAALAHAGGCLCCQRFHDSTMFRSAMAPEVRDAELRHDDSCYIAIAKAALAEPQP